MFQLPNSTIQEHIDFVAILNFGDDKQFKNLQMKNVSAYLKIGSVTVNILSIKRKQENQGKADRNIEGEMADK